MPHHEDSTRLRHMLDAGQKIVEFLLGKNREDLDSDEQLALAVVRLLEVVGEAANQVSVPFQTAHPEIPWLALRGTRNRLIHGYFDVDYEVVWQIVKTDLPPLIQRLKELMEERSRG